VIRLITNRVSRIAICFLMFLADSLSSFEIFAMSGIPSLAIAFRISLHSELSARLRGIWGPSKNSALRYFLGPSRRKHAQPTREQR